MCCPSAKAPDPTTCSWDIGQSQQRHITIVAFVDSRPGGFSPGSLICAGSCGNGKIQIAESADPIINGGHTACFIGGVGGSHLNGKF